MSNEDATAGLVTVRAYGALYALRVIVRNQAPDWLERTILRVTWDQRTRLSDLVHWFGVPRRIVEDTIVRMIERNHLVLDVHAGTIEATKIAAIVQEDAHTEELVWQDRLTGMVIPWRRLAGSQRAPEGPIEEIGGPLATRGLLEMSDVELLSILESVDARFGDIERTAEREPRGDHAIYVVARPLGGGRYLFDTRLESGAPWQLARAWERAALGRPDGTDLAGALSGVEVIADHWYYQIEAMLGQSPERMVIERAERANASLRHVIAAAAHVALYVDDSLSVDLKTAMSKVTHRVVALANSAKAAQRVVRHLDDVKNALRVIVVPDTDVQSSCAAAAKDQGTEVRVEARLSALRGVEWLLVDDRDLWLLDSDGRTAVRVRQSGPLYAVLALAGLDLHPGVAVDESAPGEIESTSKHAQLLSLLSEIWEEARTLGRASTSPDATRTEKLLGNCKSLAERVRGFRPDLHMLRATTLGDVVERLLFAEGEDRISAIATASDGAVGDAVRALGGQNIRVDHCVWTDGNRRAADWRVVGRTGPACLLVLGDTVALGPDATPGHNPSWYETHDPRLADEVRDLVRDARRP